MCATHVALPVDVGEDFKDIGICFTHVALPVDVGEDFVDFDVGIAHNNLSPLLWGRAREGAL